MISSNHLKRDFILAKNILSSVFLAVVMVFLPSLLVFSNLNVWLITGLSFGSASIITCLVAFTSIRHMQQQLMRSIQLAQNITLNQHRDKMPVSEGGPFSTLNYLLCRKQKQISRHYQVLRVASDRMRQIYEQSNDAIFIIEPESGRIIDCNPKACSLLKHRRDQILSKTLAEILHLENDTIRPLLDEASANSLARNNCLQLTLESNSAICLDINASRLDMDDRQLVLLIGRDLREREDAEHRIRHLAYHDTLTDLPNRTLLTDRVNRALKRTHRSKQIGALLFLDLDDFKRINDSLGHSIGDLLLQELADRLRHTLREEDTISRLGGDEFVVLIEQLGTDLPTAEKQLQDIADKVRDMFKKEYILDGHELHVTASIGFVTFPRDGETMETLLRHADMAMYHSKKAGRNTTTPFDQGMDDAAAHRMRVEKDIRTAMREDQLELYYQPVLGIRDGKMLGAEALLRWIHPIDGEIRPDNFLPQIQDSALMLRLAEWVLRNACEQLAEISNNPRLFTPDYLAINLSHHQFHQPNFVEQVKCVIEETGVDPRRIQFEITETIIMSNSHEARKRMLELKQMGITFAIDDFGTGYSSLAYLKQLPADTLKIDKSFVRDITTDEDDAAIVKTILGIADHLGLRIIAEGVERQEQLQFLRENGCTYYQGFLGREPLCKADFHDDLLQSLHLRLVK